MIPAPNLPRIIASRYRPIRLIAAGGMGAVYEVEHVHTGEHLALKVLLLGVDATPDTLERFKREARVSARIKSEHVVRVTDADVAPELAGAPFLVMELLEGMDLERAAVVAPPTPETVIAWLRQVAQAIDKAHDLGIVHRDLKPENLFLTNGEKQRPIVKVLDFGIAKMIEEGAWATGTGQMIGTPKYMAPEQVTSNANVTPAADRCALGLVAYRLLVGESYYQGGVMSILGQLLHDEIRAPSERGCRFGNAFDAWFLKACQRDPEQRFSSASAQIEALAGALGVSKALGDGTLPAVSAPASTFQSPVKRARRAFLVVAVLASASIVAFAASHVLETDPHGEPVCGLTNRATNATACGNCMAQSCCQEARECSELEGCPELETCVRACASGDVECRGKCYSARAAVAQSQRGVETCRASHCTNECLPGPWECLGRVQWPFPRLTPRTITIKTTATCASCGAGGGQAPLPGTSVRLCSLADPGCDLPLAASTADASGAVTLNVDTTLYPPPLAVFLEYKKDGYLDSLANLATPPISLDLDLGPIPLLHPKVNVAGFASMLGTTYDPARAHIMMRPFDCNGQPAADKVAVTWLDRDDLTASTPYFAYLGTAGAINLPINAARLTRVAVRVTETNQLVAMTSVVVRPGAVTFMGPVPAP